MKKIIFIFIQIVILFSQNLFPQKLEQPKLIVGIVVDQMRFNDLYRYYDLYSDKGFKKLINEGSNFTNAHYNYVPTNTGPGHASIYTGTTPYYHGIINNDFYDRHSKRYINCVHDDKVFGIGTNGDEGKKSPKNLFATTITDALKLFTNKQSKVFSISVKDRGAILPGGRTADGAFWYDSQSGNFISSSYYYKDMPEWLKEFNQQRFADYYLNNGWPLLLDKKFYYINNPDENYFEPDFFNEGKTSFPHSFKNLNDNEKYDKLIFTPFIHEMLVKLAQEIVIKNKLGKNSVTDFLAISFSSTDYVGHIYGNYSYELMDLFVRLDRQLAQLLEFLDKEIGKDNYLLFLTSDHGALETPAYLKESRISTGEIGNSRVLDSLKAYSKRKFGSDEILEIYSYGMIYFNREFIAKNNLKYSEVEESFSEYLRFTFPEIQKISRRSYMENQTPERENSDLVLNGWHPFRSADIVFTLLPGYLYRFMDKGTTHGSSYNYDTHIPLIFYGWKVPNQTINEKCYITDIAPTIASLIKIDFPNASIGKPLLK